MITDTKRYLLGQIVFTILCLLLFILFIMNSSTVSKSIQASITLCTQTIIPALFPYFILSELILSSNIGNLLCKTIGKPCSVLFGISEISFYPIVIGALCGFPIGAKLTTSLLDKGYITPKEAERTLCLCNNPSPTFLINVVGISLYSNKKLGVILWLITLSTTFIIGICYNLLFGRTFKKFVHINNLNNKITFSKITQIIGESIYPVLKTCAYIIFFSALMGCLILLKKRGMIYMYIFGILYNLQCFLINAIKINEYTIAILYGVIELSGGVNQISLLNNNILSLCILSFAIGWAGVSVHLQIMSICQSQNINLKQYIFSKFFQGLLNIATILAVHAVAPDLFDINNTTTSIPSFYKYYVPIFQNIILIIFLGLALLYLYKNITKQRLLSYISIRQY